MQLESELTYCKTRVPPSAIVRACPSRERAPLFSTPVALVPPRARLYANPIFRAGRLG